MSTKKKRTKKKTHIRCNRDIYNIYTCIPVCIYIKGNSCVPLWTVFVDSVVTVFFCLPWSECNPVIYYFLKIKRNTQVNHTGITSRTHTTTNNPFFLPAYSETHT